MPARAPISSFVVCCNEERHIAACLDSLSFCDEILVIDSFSSDKTVEIARSMGATVVQRAWPGYRAQKAFGLQSVAHEWVLNLDADERISAELRESILDVLERDAAGDPTVAKTNGYYLNRVVYHLGRWWKRSGWYPEYRLRLLRRSKARWAGTDPHEKAEVSGRTARLRGDILHYSYRNLDDQFSRLLRYAKLSAEQEFAKGVRVGWPIIVLNPLARFVKFFILRRGFTEGTAGLVVALAESYYAFAKYAKLWELQHYPEASAEEIPELETVPPREEELRAGS